MKHNMTSKKFLKKSPNDEWFEVVKKQSGLGVSMYNKKREVMFRIGNYKKWISVKYYGYKEEEAHIINSVN